MPRRKIVAGDGDRTHGTRNGYVNHGCRCDPCRKAAMAVHWPDETPDEVVERTRREHGDAVAAIVANDLATRTKTPGGPRKGSTTKVARWRRLQRSTRPNN